MASDPLGKSGITEFGLPSVGEVPEQFERGRPCAENGCPTVLSIWNPGPFCFLHSDIDDDPGDVPMIGADDYIRLMEAA